MNMNVLEQASGEKTFMCPYCKGQFNSAEVYFNKIAGGIWHGIKYGEPVTMDDGKVIQPWGDCGPVMEMK